MEMPTKDVNRNLGLGGRCNHSRKAARDAALECLGEPMHEATINLFLELKKLLILSSCSEALGARERGKRSVRS